MRVACYLLLVLMTVTAYHRHARCADGSRPRPGTCAAYKGIPMHSRVKVKGHSYLVTDRCRRGVDIYMSSTREAKRWGRQRCDVRRGR